MICSAAGDTLLRAIALFWKAKHLIALAPPLPQNEELLWEDSKLSLQTAAGAMEGVLMSHLLPALISASHDLDSVDAVGAIASLCSAHSAVLHALTKCSERYERCAAIACGDSSALSDTLNNIDLDLCLRRLRGVAAGLALSVHGMACSDDSADNNTSPEWFLSAILNITSR